MILGTYLVGRLTPPRILGNIADMPGNHLEEYVSTLTVQDLPWVWEMFDGGGVNADKILESAWGYYWQNGNVERILNWRLPPADALEAPILEVNALSKRAVELGDPSIVTDNPRARAYETFIAAAAQIDESWRRWQAINDEMDAKYGSPEEPGVVAKKWADAISIVDQRRFQFVVMGMHICQRALEVAVRSCVSHGLMRYTTELHGDLTVVDPDE